MAVPRNRQSKGRTGRRNAHSGRVKINMLECKNCQKPRLAHHMCLSCGMYDGRSVLSENSAEKA